MHLKKIRAGMNRARIEFAYELNQLRMSSARLEHYSFADFAHYESSERLRRLPEMGC